MNEVQTSEIERGYVVCTHDSLAAATTNSANSGLRGHGPQQEAALQPGGEASELRAPGKRHTGLQEELPEILAHEPVRL